MSSPVTDSSSPAPRTATSSSADASRDSSRLPIIIALVLAVLFVIAVVVGARIVMERQSMVPIAMGPVDAPDAESQTCSQYISDLPQELGGYKNVGLVDPAPAGAAGYRNLAKDELTVRCGVRLPDQYTVLSPTIEADGSKWLEVVDATPGSDLRTWYSVGSSPAVAVTSSNDITEQLGSLGHATKSFPGEAPEPGPYPLSEIPMVSSSDANSVCSEFLNALPDSFAGYAREEREGAPSRSATYLSTDSAEPVVVRCGAELPESYGSGENITQVNDVAWFAEPSVAQGSTTGVWYALSHEQIVAVSMPNNVGNAAVDAVTEAISSTMKLEQK